MVDLRILYKEQLDYCTAIANDIIKHKGSKEICEYASQFCELEHKYDKNSGYEGEFIRVNFGECYCYLKIDESENPTGVIYYCNDEMGRFEDYGSYEGTAKFLETISKEDLYEFCAYSECYDEFEGIEKGYIKYKPMP